MIIHHARARNVYYWQTQPLLFSQSIGAGAAPPAVSLIAQARSVSRFVAARVFGRVN